MSNHLPAGGPAAATALGQRELAAWRGFLRAHTALTRELDAELAAAHNLTLSSYEVLLFVSEAPTGRVRMSELADHVLLSRSGLTRLVDRMAQEGMVERHPCSEDARGWFAVVTPKGRRTFEAARRTHLDGVRRMFVASFSESELELLRGCFGRLGC